MNHDEWLERAEIYALGALDGEELRQFEAHLASGCALCEMQLSESREALVELPASLAPLEPPQRVKAELLRRIGPAKIIAAPERSASRWFRWGVGAGALAAAALLMIVSWDLMATKKQLRDLQGQLAALQGQVAQREEVVQFLSDPQVRIVNLTGLPPTSSAKGQLLWNPVSRKGLLLTTGLPQTPAEKAYELWGLAGAEATPAGVFTVNERGQVLFRLPALPEAKNFDKFAVTLEPARGVPKATGPIVLVGSL
jgi:anti-sigma-K factor RskA